MTRNVYNQKGELIEEWELKEKDKKKDKIKRVKGFLVEPGQKNYVYDEQILGLEKSMVMIMMHKLSAYDYMVWKTRVANDILVERVETDALSSEQEYNPSAQDRINNTALTIEHNEALIKRYAIKETRW